MRARFLAGFALLAVFVPAARGQDATPVSGRPADDLLERPELQAIVDQQVERDGPAIAERLTDADPALRARAAFALASVQDPAAVPVLVEALGDPDPRVRADAAFALGQTADSSAAAALIDAVQGEADPAVRRELLEAAGETVGGEELARLAGLDLPPDDRTARARAAGRAAIRGVFDVGATRRLLEILPADYDGALVAAGEGGGRTRETWAAVAWFFARADTVAWASHAGRLRAALDALFLLQGASPSRASGAAGPPEPNAALHLLTALGRLSDPADRDRLTDWLASAGDWRTRVEAARAIGRLPDAGDAAAREALFRALADRSTHVAIEAARALSAAESLPVDLQKRVALKFMDRSLPWQVTAALAPGLVRADGEGVVMLKYTGIAGGTTQENPFERAALLEALGHDDERPGFLLLRHEARADDPRIAAAAIAALGERWERGVVGGEATAEAYFGIFAAALSRADLATASVAAPLLADSAFVAMGALDSLAATWRRMEAPVDIEPMVEILEALREMGNPAGRAILDEALAHPHPVLRRAAGDTIADPSDVPPPERGVDWDRLRELGAEPRLVLETDRGRVVVRLATEAAPLTVQTVLELAREGRYDGVPFHRVVPNFVIQGGDFERGDGYGGPGYAIRSEFTRLPFERGTIGIASAGKDTEGSQYFVTHGAQRHLDGRYTAFGTIVEGVDVVDRILQGDRVRKATVEPDRLP